MIQLRKGRWLILDTSVSWWWVGLLCDGQAPFWRGETRPVLECFFESLAGVDVLLEGRWDALDGVVFCRGPGSTMGLRTSCLFLNSLRLVKGLAFPLYAYHSLHLAARLSSAFCHATAVKASMNDAYVARWTDPSDPIPPIERVTRNTLDGKNLIWLPHIRTDDVVAYRLTPSIFLSAPQCLFSPTKWAEPYADPGKPREAFSV